MADDSVEVLLRRLAPQVLGVLARRYADFAAAEDAVQEALIAAAERWPRDGVPENPRGWLIQVAQRRMTDHIRSESARRGRELRVASEAPAPADVPDRDDTVTLLLMCCHPALSETSAIALTLRAVGGLTTAEIASAFLVPTATMAQRISRAKASIKAAGATFRLPPPEEQPDRLRSVLHVLYLIFNEGYTTSSGPELHRVELSAEAIRLTRVLHEMLPDQGEVTGLLALMLLTDARREGRTTATGAIVPLAEQDRSRWDAELIAEGVELVTSALRAGSVGEYQLQAAIAACHDEATSAEDTDWPQILALYGLLDRMTGNPMVALSRAVAASMVHGPEEGLRRLAPLDRRLPGHHRLDAVRGHLYEQLGDVETAAELYRRAAERTSSVRERDYLTARAARLHR
ncbi:MAG: RNA polymerase sigma factor [Mycobacteriales bacterium]